MTEHTQPKHSLFFTVGLSILLAVVGVMVIHASYKYWQERTEIIEDMVQNSRSSTISLEKSIANLIEAYAINEYESLLANELERHNSFAIIVEDYNMGKILGKRAYQTGKLRYKGTRIIDYDANNPDHKNLLANSYYSHKRVIKNAQGQEIGRIAIYNNDKRLNEKLNEIIFSTAIDTIALALLHVLALFFVLRKMLVVPISEMTGLIAQTDKDGIPIHEISSYQTEELDVLSRTINRMIQSIRTSRKQLNELNATLETRVEDTIEEIRKKDAIIHEHAKRRAKDDLLIDLAHHWRQPVNTAAIEVQNITDLLDGCQDTAEIKEIVDIVLQELTGLSRTITRLTHFYEKKASVSVSLQEGLEQTIHLIKHSLLARGIRIETEIGDDFTFQAEADDWVNLFTALFLNVQDIQNQRKLGYLTISISTRSSALEQILVIEDNAGGIDENLLPDKLFEAYTTTQFKMRDRGLGLYTVYNIVNYRLQGKIYAENTGKGAKFIIRIPNG